MRNSSLIAALITALAVSGCNSYHIASAAQAQSAINSRTGATFVFGLIGTEATAIDCKAGLAFVETSEPWWGFIATGITFGLITPWHAEWACVAEGSAK